MIGRYGETLRRMSGRGADSFIISRLYTEILSFIHSEFLDWIFFIIMLFFRMYDVDGNGVIDQDEMSKIIQVVIIENMKNWVLPIL